VTVVVMAVRVKAPPGMEPAQVCREVRASIGFGHPEVSLLHILDEEDADNAGGP
jgi:hypothetical protein